MRPRRPQRCVRSNNARLIRHAATHDQLNTAHTWGTGARARSPRGEADPKIGKIDSVVRDATRYSEQAYFASSSVNFCEMSQKFKLTAFAGGNQDQQTRSKEVARLLAREGARHATRLVRTGGE